jgi:hypothetical protein
MLASLNVIRVVRISTSWSSSSGSWVAAKAGTATAIARIDSVMAMASLPERKFFSALEIDVMEAPVQKCQRTKRPPRYWSCQRPFSYRQSGMRAQARRPELTRVT